MEGLLGPTSLTVDDEGSVTGSTLLVGVEVLVGPTALTVDDEGSVTGSTLPVGVEGLLGPTSLTVDDGGSVTGSTLPVGAAGGDDLEVLFFFVDLFDFFERFLLDGFGAVGVAALEEEPAFFFILGLVRRCFFRM